MREGEEELVIEERASPTPKQRGTTAAAWWCPGGVSVSQHICAWIKVIRDKTRLPSDLGCLPSVMRESLIYLTCPHNDCEAGNCSWKHFPRSTHSSYKLKHHQIYTKKKREKEQKGEQTERGSNRVNANGHQQRGR